MSNEHPKEKTVFNVASAIEASELRSAYLDQVCSDDRALRERVLHLLKMHDEEPAFLDDHPEGVVATLDCPPAIESLGTQIGPYKLREQIGEGGMGVVYVAEQTKPVRRKVALKLVKPGMGSKDVIARFEAERQALAMMDHPNIAHVFDGGVIESGQPYFVMELVQGIPITEYCDEQRLSTTERLTLFTKVCRAIQHAHQRGVIHRDLKPSNIIVAEIDAEAVPKVIDFGVAKAVGHTLTEETVYTHISQMVGTPLYMSPEQTGLGVVDIDTRSDVYSLGVLLYELLTGSTPFDRETLKAAGFDEMRRMIREDEPMSPSAMVSTLKADAISTVSERRHCDPRRLREGLRGELDWLVMKALEKDRNRRYESASELAADVDRYLTGEPLKAGPPTFAYRFKKLALRHQAAIATAGLVLFALVLGLAVASWQAWRANKAQEIASENFRRARDTVNALLTKIDETELLQSEELQPLRIELLGVARDYYQNFVDDTHKDLAFQEDLAEAHLRLGNIAWALGEAEIAGKAHQEAISIRRRLVAENPDDIAIRNSLVEMLIRVFETSHADAEDDGTRIESLREAVDAAQSLENTSHEYTLAKAYTDFGWFGLQHYSINTGDTSLRDEAFQAAKAAERIVTRQLNAAPQNLTYQFAMVRVLGALTYYHRLQGNHRQADELQQQAIALLDRLQEKQLRDIAQREQLASGYNSVGKYVQAIEVYQDLATDYPTVVKYQEALAGNYQSAASDRQHPEKELAYLKSAEAIARRLHERFPTGKRYAGEVAMVLGKLARAQLEHRQPEKAIEALQESIAVLSDVKPYLVGHLADAYRTLSDTHELLGNLQQAIESQQEALSVNREIREHIPNNVKFVTAGAHGRLHLASLLRQTGKTEQSLAEVRAAISLSEPVFVDGSPDAPRMSVFANRMALRDCYREEGRILKLLDRHADAAKAFRKAIDIEAEALRGNPNKFMFHFPNRIYDEWLQSIRYSGEETDVEGVLREELLNWQTLYQKSNSSWTYQARELEMQLRLADWFARHSRFSEAMQGYERATTILEKLVGEPSTLVHAIAVGVHVCGGSTIGVAKTDNSEAQFVKVLDTHLETALAQARERTQKDPTDPYLSYWNAWSELTVAYYKPRDWAGADVEAREAIESAGDRLPALRKLAPLLLLADDSDRYRQLCKGLVSSLDRRNGDALKQTLQICLLDPQPDSPKTLLEAARRLADTSGEAYLQHVAEYRAGDFDAAIVGLEGELSSAKEESAILRMHLAIAHQLHGDNKLAAEWMERAMADRALTWRPASRLEFEVLAAELELRSVRHQEKTIDEHER